MNKLINKKHNGLIKVVTGIRRCGKAYLFVAELTTCGEQTEETPSSEVSQPGVEESKPVTLCFK